MALSFAVSAFLCPFIGGYWDWIIYYLDRKPSGYLGYTTKNTSFTTKNNASSALKVFSKINLSKNCCWIMIFENDF